MTTSQRFTAMLAATLLTTAVFASAASPALASTNDRTDARTCWIQADTGETQCFADESAMDAAIVEELGALPVEEGSVQARMGSTPVGAVAAVQYTIARLYADASYGGDFLFVSAASSTFCADGGVYAASAMPTGWNDRVSSVRSYWGCQTTLYTNAAFAGTSAVYSSSAALGTMNDKTSSYKVKS
ncbi:MAG TPA: peptidase inhibitor family I36 protein [Pseudolysinimonas sp.]|nr:peptidase inhibitor family I36 protein [Pseudolysinimonas sp.]